MGDDAKKSTGVLDDGKIGGLPAEYWENDAGLDPDRKAASMSKEAADDLNEHIAGLKKGQTKDEAA